MWPWSSGSEKPPPQSEASPAETKPAPTDANKVAAEFDPKRLPEREKLPASLQKIVDSQDKEDFLDDLYEG